MKQKLTSRKFWAFLVAVIAALGTGFTGEVSWDKVLAAIVVAVAAYAAAEGYTDGQRARGPPHP